MTVEGRTVRFREIGNDEVEPRNMNKGSEMCHNRVPLAERTHPWWGKEDSLLYQLNLFFFEISMGMHSY